MTPYQIFLLLVLILWPFAILGLLYLMSRLESYVKRTGAETPEEAGLEPVEGEPEEKEVTIVFGDTVIGAAGRARPDRRTEEGRARSDRRTEAGRARPDRRTEEGRARPDRITEEGRARPDPRLETGPARPERRVERS
jgi:hypothetical protein